MLLLSLSLLLLLLLLLLLMVFLFVVVVVVVVVAGEEIEKKPLASGLAATSNQHHCARAHTFWT